jgi:RND family efflux transporter MFP subunit
MKKKKIIILIGVAVLFLFSAGALLSGEGKQEEVNKEESITQVSVVSISDLNGIKSTISVNGRVESNNQAGLSPEVQGVVSGVPVSIGQTVSAGDPLVYLDNGDALLRLKEAEALLETQESRLEEMLSGALEEQIRNSEIAVENAEDTLEKTIEDTNEAVESALRNLLNNDLQAYLNDERMNIDDDDVITSPTISGVYEGEEGEYRISLYPSLAQSGYSFKYEGPNSESGVGSVNTRVAQPLGESGLYILFPEGFANHRDLEWVVPIPNKRGAGYLTVKDAYETALRNQEPAVKQAEQALEQRKNELALLKGGAREEQITAQKAQVSQAELGVDSANKYLERHIIRAPFSGTVASVSAQVGQTANMGQQIVFLVNENGLRVKSYLSPDNARSLSIGDSAEVDGKYKGVVSAVSRAVNEQTGQVEVQITITESSDLIVGEDVTVDIVTNSSSGVVRVPLSMIDVSSSGNAVYTVEEGVVKRVSVSLGPIQEDKITVLQGLEDVDFIIEDYSLVQSGQLVEVVNK